jgi:hypothetical protein
LLSRVIEPKLKKLVRSSAARRRALTLERRAGQLEQKLDDERVASATTLDEAVELVEAWQGTALAAQNRVKENRELAARARELARMLRDVDEAALKREQPDGRTVGDLLADAEARLLAALVENDRSLLDADDDDPKERLASAKAKLSAPSWLPKDLPKAPWDK